MVVPITRVVLDTYTFGWKAVEIALATTASIVTISMSRHHLNRGLM
jgi:hypothetical protein